MQVSREDVEGIIRREFMAILPKTMFDAVSLQLVKRCYCFRTVGEKTGIP